MRARNEGCGAGRSDVAQSNLFREAQDLYSRAIRILLRNEHYPADDLETLVEDLVRKTYRYCPRRVADPPQAQKPREDRQSSSATLHPAGVAWFRWSSGRSRMRERGRTAWKRSSK